MTVPFRSPKNLTEEMLNEVLTREANDVSRTANVQWLELKDSKELLKAILLSGLPWRNALSLFLLAMQAGFDLHAKYGDSGNAELYVVKKEINNA